MCVCVCLEVFLCVGLYLYVQVCGQAHCVQECVHICMCVYKCACAHRCMCVCECMWVQVHMYMYVCLCIETLKTTWGVISQASATLAFLFYTCMMCVWGACVHAGMCTYI